MHTQGTIVTWDEEKGYVFALIKATGVKVFVHQSESENSQYRLAVDQVISFVITEQEKGKPRETAISILEGAKFGKNVADNKAGISVWPLFLGLLFLAASVYAFYLQWLPTFVILVYGFMSLLSFLLYAKDKRAARKDQWRISEFTLQLTALLCGWPGALIGRGLFRHKTKKLLFSVSLYCIALMHLAGLSWLFTEQGQILVFSFAINLSFYLAGTGLCDVFQVVIWKLKYYFNLAD
jgi:uncharacterized membrane protein YsdA (DUF1294 family)/cold shock CspA family protein